MQAISSVIVLFLLALPLHAEPVVERAAKATVCISAPREGVLTLRGAGCVVGKGLVLTNKHVVRDDLKVFVTLEDGTAAWGKVLRADEARDIALIRVKLDVTPFRFTLRPARRGDEVWAIGHPFDRRWSLSKGVVGAVKRDVEFPNTTLLHMLQHTAAINPGNSGGPVFSKRGDLLGMTTCMHAGQGLAFAITAADLQAFLKETP